MPYQAFVILPYAVSILALVGLVGKPRPPGAVGLPYRRESKKVGERTSERSERPWQATPSYSSRAG